MDQHDDAKFKHCLPIQKRRTKSGMKVRMAKEQPTYIPAVLIVRQGRVPFWLSIMAALAFSSSAAFFRRSATHMDTKRARRGEAEEEGNFSR